jgi:Xaa-Pro aminopeptidase
VINQKQQVRIFVDHRDYEQIKKTVKGYHIELFERYSQFASWIKTQHFQTVLIEADTLTVSQFDRLIKPLKFPHVINFNSDQLRIVKTPAEIKAIKKACDIAVAGVAYLRKIAKVGVTERYLKDSLIKFFLNKYNVVPSFDPIILSGPNTALPHGVSGNRKIKRGEFILVDIGCIYHNYCSDISRTF